MASTSVAPHASLRKRLPRGAADGLLVQIVVHSAAVGTAAPEKGESLLLLYSDRVDLVAPRKGLLRGGARRLGSVPVAAAAELRVRQLPQGGGYDALLVPQSEEHPQLCFTALGDPRDVPSGASDCFQSRLAELVAATGAPPLEAQWLPPGADIFAQGPWGESETDLRVLRRPGEPLGLQMDGMLLQGVEQGSAADEAGAALLTGATLLAVDGAPVASGGDFREALRRAGAAVLLRFSPPPPTARRQPPAEGEVTLTLRRRPGEPLGLSMGGLRLGTAVAGSAADEAGAGRCAGWRLVRAAGRPVHSPSDLPKLLGGDAPTVEVVFAPSPEAGPPGEPVPGSAAASPAPAGAGPSASPSAAQHSGGAAAEGASASASSEGPAEPGERAADAVGPGERAVLLHRDGEELGLVLSDDMTLVAVAPGSPADRGCQDCLGCRLLRVGGHPVGTSEEAAARTSKLPRTGAVQLVFSEGPPEPPSRSLSSDSVPSPVPVRPTVSADPSGRRSTDSLASELVRFRDCLRAAAAGHRHPPCGSGPQPAAPALRLHGLPVAPESDFGLVVTEVPRGSAAATLRCNIDSECPQPSSLATAPAPDAERGVQQAVQPDWIGWEECVGAGRSAAFQRPRSAPTPPQYAGSCRERRSSWARVPCPAQPRREGDEIIVRVCRP